MTAHYHTRICRWVVRDGQAVCTAEPRHVAPVQAWTPTPTRKRWFRR